MSEASSCACGCVADAPAAHAIVRALAVDDVDAALEFGLMNVPVCMACADACRARVDAARLERGAAFAARERYRARNARLADWALASGPAGRESHPNYREEHLLPLHVAAGAAGARAGRKVFTDEVLSVAISAFRFD